MSVANRLQKLVAEPGHPARYIEQPNRRIHAPARCESRRRPQHRPPRFAGPKGGAAGRQHQPHLTSVGFESGRRSSVATTWTRPPARSRSWSLPRGEVPHAARQQQLELGRSECCRRFQQALRRPQAIDLQRRRRGPRRQSCSKIAHWGGDCPYSTTYHPTGE